MVKILKNNMNICIKLSMNDYLLHLIYLDNLNEVGM